MRGFNIMVCIILWLMFLTCIVTVSHAAIKRASPIVVWSQWMTEHISAKYDISEEQASSIMEEVTQMVVITGSCDDGQYTWNFTKE
jgi:hypothetical protein